jgi:predicted DNA-binding transcriptional regulator AlpA
MSDRELLARKNELLASQNARKKRLVRTKEAAQFLDLAEGTLVVDRSTKRINIPYYKIGGAVRYDLNELEAFLESRKVEPVEAR